MESLISPRRVTSGPIRKLRKLQPLAARSGTDEGAPERRDWVSPCGAYGIAASQSASGWILGDTDAVSSPEQQPKMDEPREPGSPGCSMATV